MICKHLDIAYNDIELPSRLLNLSFGMRKILSSYTRAINAQESRTGSLFRKRTKAEDGKDKMIFELGGIKEVMRLPLHVYRQTETL